MWSYNIETHTALLARYGMFFMGRRPVPEAFLIHYNDIIMDMMASQITSFTTFYSTVYSGADQRKHQNSASLAFCVDNSPVTSEFASQMTKNAENISTYAVLYVRLCYDGTYHSRVRLHKNLSQIAPPPPPPPKKKISTCLIWNILLILLRKCVVVIPCKIL